MVYILFLHLPDWVRPIGTSMPKELCLVSQEEAIAPILPRAALDSIAYQTYDVLKAMEADSGIQIKELRVDGGATVNNQLMQFQSDILNCKVVRPIITETTALGAAYLAGLAVGYWKNIDDIQQQWQVDKAFAPQIKEDKRNELVKGWQRAVKASIAWADHSTSSG